MRPSEFISRDDDCREEQEREDYRKYDYGADLAEDLHLCVSNATIVADRFHVIRIINHYFLNCWRELDAVGSKNRGLLSLMRRHRHNLRPEQQLRLAAYLETLPALTLWPVRSERCGSPTLTMNSIKQ